MINHIQSCCLNQPIYLLPLHIPWSIRLVSHLFFFLIYTLVLSANFPFFRNLAILLSSEIVIFMINFRPIRSIIILVKKNRILLSLVWLPTESDSTQSYYHNVCHGVFHLSLVFSWCTNSPLGPRKYKWLLWYSSYNYCLSCTCMFEDIVKDNNLEN